MIQGLIILSGAVPGIRDLMWVHGEDPKPVVGYHVFRSDNGSGPWGRLSLSPIPGNRYRDETRLDEVTYQVLPEDWVDKGPERFGFKLPTSPVYSGVDSGRVILASQPTHVRVAVDGGDVPVARVDGYDGEVWLSHAYVLRQDADWRARLTNLPGDASDVRVTYKVLGNFVDPTPESRRFYTVVPVYADGSLAHDPGAPGSEVVNTLEVDKMDFMQAEMVRRNDFLLDVGGEPCHLLIRRTRGVPCGCLVEGVARTGCLSCYETGITGGYYGPYDFMFIDPDSAATVEVEEQGRKTTRQSRAWCGPTPILQSGDLILRKNGERLVVGPVTYKSPRGVLVKQDYDVELLRPGDTRYRVPLRPPLDPIPYNPGFTESPGLSGEPVTTPLTDPTKVWENPLVPVGRTKVFTNIQS